MATGTRGPIGVQDFQMHNPAGSTAAQPFNRTSSTGGVTAMTALSAQDIILRDTALVTGARTRFEKLPDTVADKNVQKALDEIRANTPFYKNFETYGGVANSSTQADAERNTQVLTKILADFSSDGAVNGIFFPQGTYEFMQSPTFQPTITASNVRMVGTGFGSVLKRNAAAAANQPLFTFEDCGNLIVSDLQFNGTGLDANSPALFFKSTTAILQDIRVLNCRFTGGTVQLKIGTTTGLMDAFWVWGCTFTNASGKNLSVENAKNGHVLYNYVTTGGTGISIESGGGASAPILDIDIIGNILKVGSLTVLRIGVGDATFHRCISIKDNQLAAGNIAVTGIDRATIEGNKVLAGGIVYSTDLTTTKDIRINDNEIIGSTGPGINFIALSSDVQGVEIRGGKIESCVQEGIRIQAITGTVRYARIESVLVLNCSRENIAAEYAGILLEGVTGGGVVDSIVQGNIIRCTTATGLGLRHKYGVWEKTGGASNRNVIGPNHIKGFTVANADVLISGAASRDIVFQYAGVDGFCGTNLASAYDQGSGL